MPKTLVADPSAQSPLGAPLPVEQAYPVRNSRFRWPVALTAVALMLGAVLLANKVTTDYGFIPVGLGFEATAGTLFAGVALASRDLIQDALGRWAVVLTIAIGTVLSFAIAAPEIAVASAAAFGMAELLDFIVYSPLRDRAQFGDRRWAVAVVASNIVGAVTDTLVFLGIAFGIHAILPALPGQMVGKLWATLGYLILGAGIAWLIRRYAYSKPRPAQTA